MKHTSKIEIYRSPPGWIRRGDWRFRVIAANGEIVGQGEGYSSDAGALNGVRALYRAMSGALLISAGKTVGYLKEQNK